MYYQVSRRVLHNYRFLARDISAGQIGLPREVPGKLRLRRWADLLISKQANN
jgi:hypothetical protein